MKKAKRLTKKERKALTGPVSPPANAPHIHCIACGRHLDPAGFTRTPVVANWVQCAHGTNYAACLRCVDSAMKQLADHDRSGDPVRIAKAWH